MRLKQEYIFVYKPLWGRLSLPKPVCFSRTVYGQDIIAYAIIKSPKLKIFVGVTL